MWSDFDCVSWRWLQRRQKRVVIPFVQFVFVERCVDLAVGEDAWRAHLLFFFRLWHECRGMNECFFLANEWKYLHSCLRLWIEETLELSWAWTSTMCRRRCRSDPDSVSSDLGNQLHRWRSNRQLQPSDNRRPSTTCRTIRTIRAHCPCCQNVIKELCNYHVL